MDPVPGDIVFHLRRVFVPVLYICYLGVRYRAKRTAGEDEEALVHVITPPASATFAATSEYRSDRESR